VRVVLVLRDDRRGRAVGVPTAGRARAARGGRVAGRGGPSASADRGLEAGRDCDPDGAGAVAEAAAAGAE
jgi:hypothetical protein